MKTTPNALEAATKALERFEKMEEAKRGYERESWHCVNVKRYRDGLDMDDLLELAREQFPNNEELAAKLAEDIKGRLDDDQGDGIYSYWLRDQWDQLNYEVSDIVALGMREKPFSHIRTSYNWAKNKSILSLGRGGGWACFQMDGEEAVADALRDLVEEYKDPESAHDKRDTARELEEATKALLEILDEAEDIKAFIEKFNTGLDFKEEVRFRMEEAAGEMRDEAAEKERKEEIHFQAIFAKNEIARMIRDYINGRDTSISTARLRHELRIIEKYTGELNQPSVEDIITSDRHDL